jgi:hypothetical protein
MSNCNKFECLFSEAEYGSVKLIHHSAASVIELQFTSDEEESQGGNIVPRTESIWIGYRELSDLITAINIIKITNHE